MTLNWKRSNDEDIEELDGLDVIDEVSTPNTDSGYITIRRITYDKVTPAIKVLVGEDVPTVIINDRAAFENLLSKGAIVKKEI
jgi:hypothetical protein